MSKSQRYIPLPLAAIITGLMYYFTYMFEIGYLSYYNIPSSFMEINSSIVIRRTVFLIFINMFFIILTEGTFGKLATIMPKEFHDDIRMLSPIIVVLIYLSIISIYYNKFLMQLKCIIIYAIILIYQVYRNHKDEKIKTKEETPVFLQGVVKNYFKLYKASAYIILVIIMGYFVREMGSTIASLNLNEVDININNRKAIVVSEYKSKLIIKYKKYNSNELEDGFSVVDIKDDCKMILKKEKEWFTIAPF